MGNIICDRLIFYHTLYMCQIVAYHIHTLRSNSSASQIETRLHPFINYYVEEKMLSHINDLVYLGTMFATKSRRHEALQNKYKLEKLKMTEGSTCTSKAY
uniref:AlNc14C189G8409 protein n=1 Tax=Albugo laibachii Nc14 TaxID=890382 RepID=F0WPR7_9STRA|nr:AlNc14C189G8409 [Albugo laibachii Nc14]CCA24346.1 AlNc14C235G9364 [Albugo laibachii Nc14]|eukprot:CCA24346.1 AlNc14C235G9364 [Albugo laibachii Nc14]